MFWILSGYLREKNVKINTNKYLLVHVTTNRYNDVPIKSIL
jgi:hypothetical protein